MDSGELLIVELSHRRSIGRLSTLRMSKTPRFSTLGPLASSQALARAGALPYDGLMKRDPSTTDPSAAGLRVPPHSIEAEQSVLGGLLIDNSTWDSAADQVAERDFYRLEHRLIFGAIARLVMAGRPADVITVHDELLLQGKAEECGGLSYLNALAQSVPSTANLKRYAEIVRERAVLRKPVTAGDEIVSAALAPNGRSVAAILDEAESQILRIGEEGARAERKASRGWMP